MGSTTGRLTSGCASLIGILFRVWRRNACYHRPVVNLIPRDLIVISHLSLLNCIKRNIIGLPVVRGWRFESRVIAGIDNYDDFPIELCRFREQVSDDFSVLGDNCIIIGMFILFASISESDVVMKMRRTCHKASSLYENRRALVLSLGYGQ